MALIEIRNVYKIFGEGREQEAALDLARAGVEKNDVLVETGCTLGLKDVSLSVERGETFVVMGLSGSGKSTLIRHINRLIDPTTGQVLVDGRDVLEFSPEELLAFRRGAVSMVFQRFALFPHMTVLENVGYGLEVQGVDPEERRRRAMAWIEDVELTGYENAYPAQLSGGMQQRVGLARALCTDPEILLMDEPFSALDPLIRKQMQEHLIALQRDLKKTIVFITHDLDEALHLGDHVAILKDGVIDQIGKPNEILLRPATDYVREFVREVKRGRILKTGDVMWPPDEAAAGPTISRDAVLQDALPVSMESESPLRVVDETGAVVGVLSRSALLRGLTDRGGEM